MVVTMSLSDVLNNTATTIVAASWAYKWPSRSASPRSGSDGGRGGGPSAFLTPIGHKNNTLILGPGGYSLATIGAWGCRWRSLSSPCRSPRSCSSGRRTRRPRASDLQSIFPSRPKPAWGQMDILINVVLPLSLAIIMLSLGVGLTVSDFTRVAKYPRAFALGALCQVVLVPAAAWAVAMAFGLRGELAVGLMILSFCPGGVTSNMISKFARGDVALSVTLTAVVSLLSILTVPVFTAIAVRHFMGDAAPDVSVAALAVAMFVITTLPVALGLACATSPRLPRGSSWASALAALLFVLIVLAALAGNWSVSPSLARLGPALISMNAALMLLGLGIAAAAGLAWQTRKTISIEVGIQNATLGITLAVDLRPNVGVQRLCPALGGLWHHDVSGGPALRPLDARTQGDARRARASRTRLSF